MKKTKTFFDYSRKEQLAIVKKAAKKVEVQQLQYVLDFAEKQERKHKRELKKATEAAYIKGWDDCKNAGIVEIEAPRLTQLPIIKGGYTK